VLKKGAEIAAESVKKAVDEEARGGAHSLGSGEGGAH
jgi:hypothetical protein